MTWRDEMEEALPGARARSAAQRDAADVETRARERFHALGQTSGEGPRWYIWERGGAGAVIRNIADEGLAHEIASALNRYSTALTSSREGALREAHTAMACAIAFCGRGPGGTNNRSPKKWAAMCSQIADLLVKADQRVLEAIPTPQEQAW